MADCGEGGRYMYRCWLPPVEGCWLPQVHKACAHNAVRGLLERTLGRHPGPTDEGLLRFRNAGRELRRVLRGRVESVVPWSHDEVVRSYKVARLRVRYEEAARSLLADGLCGPEDAKVSAFVKAEKLANYKVHKPRVIMGRTPRYNLELAAFLKPLEHEVYPAFRGWGRRFLTRTRLIGKGLNGEERACLIRRKMLSHPDVVAFEVDCKSFESHVTIDQLDVEHGIYDSLCRDPRLRKLLSYQREFAGKFRSGVRFRVRGCRASGDFNTGLGNTLIMCCLVLSTAKLLGTRFDFLADGDNAVIFVLRKDLPLWQRELAQSFLSMGHEADIGETVSSVEEVVFGQSKPLLATAGWTMVRNPYKVMSHAFCGHQHYSEMRGGLKVLKAVALCEAHLSRGVPVLQEFAHAMLERLHSVKLPQVFEGENLEYQRAYAEVRGRGYQVKREHIPDSTRLLFEKSWGVPVGEQLRLERAFSVGDLPSSWAGVPAERTFNGAIDPFELPLDEVTASWLARY